MVKGPLIYVMIFQKYPKGVVFCYINLGRGALNTQLFHHQMIPLGHMNIPAWLFLQYNLIFISLSLSESGYEHVQYWYYVLSKYFTEGGRIHT